MFSSSGGERFAVFQVLRSCGDRLDHDQVLRTGHGSAHRAERRERRLVDRLVLEVRPRHRDVELHAGGLVLDEKHEALACELHGVGDARDDPLLRQRFGKRGDVDQIAAHSRVDVRRHPPNAMRDHGDAADDRSWHPGRVERARQARESLLEAFIAADGLAWHWSESAPSGGEPRGLRPHCPGREVLARCPSSRERWLRRAPRPPRERAAAPCRGSAPGLARRRVLDLVASGERALPDQEPRLSETNPRRR